ncbi:MAG: hypothetical protein ACL93V_08770 [Candidatus Electrothrix sp. YB6]
MKLRIKQYFDIDDNTNKLLFLLLAADLAFVLIHLFYMAGILESVLFSVEKDKGYAEFYQYTKELWIILLLSIIAIKEKRIVYISWAALFFYFLLDDSFRVHEQLGEFLVNYFGFHGIFNLRAQDFGELAVSAVFGVLLFSFIGWAYLFSTNHERKISHNIFLLACSLVFFGVVVDVAHVAIPWGGQVFGLIEDAGEMVIVSIMVWYLFGLKFAAEESSPSPAVEQQTS